MKKLFVTFLLSLFVLGNVLNAQINITLDNYNTFKNSHKNMSAEDLMGLYPAGYFKDKISFPTDVKYLDSVSIKYGLTDYELSLLRKHGFVVTERENKTSFLASFTDIFHKDLPVFISSDAILHALHASYDEILKDVELSVLIPHLQEILDKLKDGEDSLRAKYGNDTLMVTSLKDIDLYISIALKLMGENVTPYYSDNSQMFIQVLSSIRGFRVVDIPLFSENERRIDFSQFKPRGHYTDMSHPILENYFQTMMWLGRIEFYLIAPKGVTAKNSFRDIQRQIIDAYMLEELFTNSSINELYEKINKTIIALVGEQDNVTLENLRALKDSLGINSAFYFEDKRNISKFGDLLVRQSFADQKILSHILISSALGDTIKPASAFLPFGQRFVIDSYITGNVVYDKIEYNGRRIFRALPKLLDVMFSMGNSAAAQLLKTELETYHYATNLAALRYLIDSYDENFWNLSFYNLWLNAIRSLKPSADRGNLPPFMQTAAWNQEKLNTQLASWTELRHDNLLYAKQSYTGGVICSFPYGYVEPIPKFYEAVSQLGRKTAEVFSNLGFTGFELQGVIGYFNTLADVADMLKSIAEKELNGTPFTTDEINFLKSVIKYNTSGICGSAVFNGWYTKLYYGYQIRESALFDKNFVVADYHTAPTDEIGRMVGWVAHAGTGPINLAVVEAKLPSGENVAFCGPVYSYYEYTTTNFFRINDEEWDSLYLAQSTRPDWVNLYLADKDGNSRGGGRSLLTKVENTGNKVQPVDYIVAENYPNPFGSSSSSEKSYTTIVFNVPVKFSGKNFSVKVYDITGQEVAELLNQNLTTGNYLVRWYGKSSSGMNVASGVYIYRISVGNYSVEGKMNLIK